MSDRRRYDPRLGDEDIDDAHDPSTLRSPPRTPKHVHLRIPDDAHDADAPEKARERRTKSSQPPQPLFARVLKALPFNLAWIPASFTRSKLKPVIRCAVVCWVSALFMIIPQTMKSMGQVRTYSERRERRMLMPAFREAS